MSSAIIEDSDNVGQVMINTGRGDAQISMQVYQDIYNQITGKTEEITKISKKSIRADLDDIRQLDIKIKQILEQYQVLSINSTFTIFFDKDKKETHSSIEKFSSLNSSTNGCSDSIIAKYNFAIILPQISRAQNYTVTVRLINRITNQRKFLAEFPVGAPRSLVNMFSSKTCEIKISYVDYVVARTITTAFDEWLDALDESKESKYLNIARRVSHFIPPLFKYLSLIFCSFFIINLMPYLISKTPETYQLAIFALTSFLFIFFTYKISSAFGKFVENSIDSSSDISYLDITKGDKKIIQEACSNNRIAIYKAIFGSAITFALNFAAKYLVIHLKI